MTRATLLLLVLTLPGTSAAGGINERNHPPPGSQAKINRVIAQAYATRKPPVDHTAVYRDLHVQPGAGLNLGVNVGSFNASGIGQGPRENNVVTRDNIVICLHCR